MIPSSQSPQLPRNTQTKVKKFRQKEESGYDSVASSSVCVVCEREKERKVDSDDYGRKQNKSKRIKI